MGVDMGVFTCEWDREVDGGWGVGGVGEGQHADASQADSQRNGTDRKP